MEDDSDDAAGESHTLEEVGEEAVLRKEILSLGPRSGAFAWLDPRRYALPRDERDYALLFEARARNDIHIGLSDEATEQIGRQGLSASPPLEVLIGGWLNSKTAVRSRGSIVASVRGSQPGGRVLKDDQKFRRFWIWVSPSTGRVLVGKGRSLVLKADGVDGLQIARFVGVSSWDAPVEYRNFVLTSRPERWPLACLERRMSSCLTTLSSSSPSAAAASLDPLLHQRPYLLEEEDWSVFGDVVFPVGASSGAPAHQVLLQAILPQWQTLPAESLLSESIGRESLRILYSLLLHSTVAPIPSPSTHPPLDVERQLQLWQAPVQWNSTQGSFVFTSSEIKSAALARLVAELGATRYSDVAVELTEQHSGITTRVGAHRVVLAAASPVFRGMLVSAFEERQTATIRVRDTSSNGAFLAFLRCVYGAQLPLDSAMDYRSQLELLRLADQWAVPWLFRALEARLARHVETSSALDAWKVGDQTSSGPLTRAAQHEVLRHFRHWTAQPAFYALDAAKWLELVVRDSLVAEELDVWRAILMWGGYPLLEKNEDAEAQPLAWSDDDVDDAASPPPPLLSLALEFEDSCASHPSPLRNLRRRRRHKMEVLLQFVRYGLMTAEVLEGCVLKTPALRRSSKLTALVLGVLEHVRAAQERIEQQQGSDAAAVFCNTPPKSKRVPRPRTGSLVRTAEEGPRHGLYVRGAFVVVEAMAECYYHRPRHGFSGWRKLVFMAPGDNNGLFHALGTSEPPSSAWHNPHMDSLCPLRLSASCPPSKYLAYDKLVENQFRHTSFVTGRPAWIQADLGAGHALACSHYVMRHDGSRNFVRNWQLLGSDDGCSWQVLSDHTGDLSIRTPGDYGHWSVRVTAPYRYFRIQMTGPNAEGTHWLALCYWELYGFYSN